MRQWGVLALVALCACDSAEVVTSTSTAAPTTTSSVVTTTSVVPTTMPQPPTTSMSSAVDDHTDGITVRTVDAVSLVIDGDSDAVCDAAATAASPNHDEMDGLVLIDLTIGFVQPPVRWLFCLPDVAGGGAGPVALRTSDSHEWLLAALDLGPAFHAGDAAKADAFDGLRAFVTYDSMVGEDHAHAYTRDGGTTWTVVEIAE